VENGDNFLMEIDGKTKSNIQKNAIEPLLEEKLIIRKDDGRYILTTAGFDVANEFLKAKGLDISNEFKIIS
jgi:predicted transcriptional regulator